MAFTVSRSTPLAPEVAWSAVTDLAEHTRDVPFTDVQAPAGGLVLGAEVIAWTRLGPLAVADRMLVTVLDPGRRLRLVKVGRLLRGWADITVRTDPERPDGALVDWTEELWLPGLRRTDPSSRGPCGTDRLRPCRRRRAGPGCRRRPGCRAADPAGERSVTWAVGLALLAVVVVAGSAWLLARPRPEPIGSHEGDDVADDGDDQVPRGRWLEPSSGEDGFRPQLRGYRMDQVDAVVDALEGRIARHDTAIAALRGEPTPPPTPTMTSTAIATPPTQAPPRTAPGSAEPGRGPAREDEPPPRRGPAAGPHDSPAAGHPAPLCRYDLLAPAGYLLLAAFVFSGLLAQPRTGYLSQGVQDQQAFEWYFGATAHNLAILLQPALHRPAELPDRRQPHGERRGAGSRGSAGAGHPARRSAADLPPRRAARTGAHGIRLVLAVPAVAAGAPARRGPRRRLRRLRPRPRLARQRPPQLRRAVPRSGSRRPRPAPGRRRPPGPRRCRAGPAGGLAAVHRGGDAPPRGHRPGRRGRGPRGPGASRPAPAAAWAGAERRSASPSSRCPCGGSSPAPELRRRSCTHRRGTTSPSSGAGPPAASVPTPWPPPRSR